MSALLRISSILLGLISVGALGYGIVESSWVGMLVFGVLSTFATFFFILTHPSHQH